MNRLRQLRKEFKISVRELEEISGIYYTTISRYETGDRKLKDAHISFFSEFFNVTNDYLVGNSEIGIYVSNQDEQMICSLEDVEEFKRLNIFSYDGMQRSVDSEQFKIIKKQNRFRSMGMKKEQIFRLVPQLNLESLDKACDYMKFLLYKQNLDKNECDELGIDYLYDDYK